MRTEIEDENFGNVSAGLGLHVITAGSCGTPCSPARITRRSIKRAYRSLAGHAALELASHFLRAALFQRISTPPAISANAQMIDKGFICLC